ncbi:MAG: succinate dehydrogenase assembly factor 2 [Gammaproteobacteria bacterium]|nr:succinate dehydrogenase assembly factor 2 [Gammaproteobacteria bacterium]
MNRNRLFWASRRGMLELDLVLLPFLDKVYDTIDPADQQRYEKLLEQEDQDLFTWLLHRSNPTDPDLQRIVQIIRDHTNGQPRHSHR